MTVALTFYNLLNSLDSLGYSYAGYFTAFEEHLVINRIDFPDHEGSFDKFSHIIQALELVSHVHLDIKSTL